MTTTPLSGKDLEAYQAEVVFGLEHGTLMGTSPLKYEVSAEDPRNTQGAFLYHYDGVPEYVEGDYAAFSHHEFFTVIKDCCYGLPPEQVIIGGKTWVRSDHFTSSGERPCPCQDYTDSDEGADPYVGVQCPLCERGADEKAHGYIYLGDGWTEVIYTRNTLDDMRQVCRTHNIQVTESVLHTCLDCRSEGPSPDEIHHEDYCERAKNPDDLAAGIKTSGLRWFWQTCIPGCLPDSDMFGPFDSELDALEDATDGLTE